jgi:SAM-dependent methyltransferase
MPSRPLRHSTNVPVARFSGVPGLRLIHSDAVGHLRRSGPYDVVLSVHAVPQIDPHRLLPTLAGALKPDGRFVFSALHTNAEGAGPSDSVTTQTETLNLAGRGKVTRRIWVLAPALWKSLLAGYGFVIDRIDVLEAPEGDSPLRRTLVQAHFG